MCARAALTSDWQMGGINGLAELERGSTRMKKVGYVSQFQWLE